MKVRDAIKLIEKNGWRHIRTTGSHRHFKHDAKPGVVTVSGHMNDELPRGTLNSIMKQALLK